MQKPHSRSRDHSFPCYLALIVLLFAGPARAAEPRFALEPGLELRYAVKAGLWIEKEGKPKITRETASATDYDKSDLTVFVLARQPEGSFRVFMQRTSGSGESIFTWADLFPDGRLSPIPTATPILESETLRSIFPLLPKSEHETKTGWQEVDSRTDVCIKFSETEGVIKAECDGPLDRVSKGHWTIQYRLDPKTHLPLEINTDGRWQTYKESHAAIITATETLRHDSAWVAKFSASAERYFEALASHRVRLHQVVALASAEREKPGSVGTLLNTEKARLIAARESITEPMFHAELDQTIKQCDDFRKTRIDSAQRWAKIAGLPAPDWKVTDLEGKEHTLRQYAGQVVVLDFWFRQCSYCMRAMPQVEQAAATFRNEKAPVSFFGASVDQEESDAKFVADTMKLTYPVLRSEKLAEQLGVKGFPTILVIAPDGTVQGIFVGHRLTLREDLTACIRGLLKK